MTMPPPPPPPPMSQVQIEEGIRPAPPPNTRVSGVVVCMNVINTITHLLLGMVAFSAFFFTNMFPFAANFTAHVYLCVIGYVILMSQAILSFSPYTGWASNLKYPQKRIAHWIMQVTGSAMAIAGGAIRMANLNSNLQTAHGIVGFIAIIFTSISLVGGVANLLFPEKTKTMVMRTLHTCIGSLTISIAFVALCLGFDSTRGSVGDINANLSISFAAFALLGTLLMAFSNMVKRGCNSE